METLSNDNTQETLLNNIINPFSLYYLCNHYYGTEIKTYNIPIPKDKNDILTTNNLSSIKDFDIVHCQVNYFEKFYSEILNNIEVKIILTTGQWHLPQIHKSDLTEKVLNHKNVLLWVSQNPIYENSSKYMAFPYGIESGHLGIYSDILKMSQTTKINNIATLPINNATNVCRKKLPVLPSISTYDFYIHLKKAKFILSPIGDRDDCYRHYEAIGLGAIPISNAGHLYRSIFGNSMYYCNIDEMVTIMNTQYIDTEYTEPDKNLICFNYFADIVRKAIAENIILKI